MKPSAEVIETVDQAIQPAREAADTAVRAGSRELRSFIADVEDVVKRIAHVGDKDVAQARAKLEQTVGAAKASLHDGTKRIQARARHAAEGTDEFVHSNPWSAIGIAAAAGAAIAVLLSARVQR